MNKERATEYIVKELGRNRSRNDIITVLCEKGGMNWRDAETFVRQVEAQHGAEITKRQSPILIFFGIGLVVVGLALTVNSLLYLVNYAQSQHAVSIDEALNIRTFYFKVISLLTGLGMIIGGIIGNWQTITKLINQE